jgi:hypothetical protein
VSQALGAERDEPLAMRAYVRRLRTRFAVEHAIAASVRAAVSSRLIDGVAALYGHPTVRRAVVQVLGSALAGSSVRASNDG